MPRSKSSLVFCQWALPGLPLSSGHGITGYEDLNPWPRPAKTMWIIESHIELHWAWLSDVQKWPKQIFSLAIHMLQTRWEFCFVFMFWRELFFGFCFCWDRVPLCSLGGPGTHRDLLVSAFASTSTGITYVRHHAQMLRGLLCFVFIPWCTLFWSFWACSCLPGHRRNDWISLPYHI